MLTNHALPVGDAVTAINTLITNVLNSRNVQPSDVAAAVADVDGTLTKHELTRSSPDPRATEWTYTLGQTLNLDASYPAITPSSTAPGGLPLLDSWIVLATDAWQQVYRVTAVAESAPRHYTLTNKTTQLTPGYRRLPGRKISSRCS